jgi:hypothetical protein
MSSEEPTEFDTLSIEALHRLPCLEGNHGRRLLVFNMGPYPMPLKDIPRIGSFLTAMIDGMLSRSVIQILIQGFQHQVSYMAVVPL